MYNAVSLLNGKQVDVRIGNGRINGVVREVDASGNLIVVQQDGTLHTVSSGEILSVRQ